ncbi:LamB/YcsF family protein [Bacillus pacificus]
MLYIIWHATNPEIADAIAKAIYHSNPNLLLYGLANSEAFIQAAEKYNITLVQEAFADRTYKQDGTLTSRTEENALIKNEDEAIKASASNGERRVCKFGEWRESRSSSENDCLHGDSEKAVQFAERIYRTFELNGISI